jgi:hypothetical protein
MVNQSPRIVSHFELIIEGTFCTTMITTRELPRIIRGKSDLQEEFLVYSNDSTLQILRDMRSRRI